VLPKDVLASRTGRLVAFSALYLSEGIPFGFSAIALTAYLRQSGLDNAAIGAFTASLYAPWGFKWAWAPLVDLIQIRRFGPRRLWIACAQIMMIVTLGVIMFMDVADNVPLLTMLIVVHNLFAATQDVAIDALAVQVLPAKERGLANGAMFGASYLGQSIGGSGALFVAGAFGFAASFPFVCGMLALILLTVTLRLHEPVIAEAAAGVGRGAKSVGAAVLARLGVFLRDLRDGLFRSGRGPMLGVLFASIPGGALALGLALGTTMQVDLQMDENAIATLSLWSSIVSAAGCVIGGLVSDRFGHRKSLAVWYVLTTLPTFWLARQFTGAGMEGVTVGEYYRAVMAYSLASGLVQGTAIAVFMGLTSPLVAATQFTGYMALKNLVYSYSALWQGNAADAWGYARTVHLDAWVGFTPLLVLPFLLPSTRGRRDERREPAPAQGGLRVETVD
jgi:PAT family beta-lactamase induction signal transducer AmpG